MSNIYIQEPPTSGKVLLKTTAGDIDIELWAKETPKASRNFIQLCLEGYYDNTIFHRLVKGFIVQGGDPNGDGTGGDSIYESTFKDEFHSRLRFNRRGLVAMANAGKDDNASQFFFTLNATPELQNKHTLFGKVVGDTIYNMLKLEEGIVDEDERPMYPQKILKTEVLSNPFPDIVPRIVQKQEQKEKDKKPKRTGVKNFKLLSFGEEAEEDEETSKVINEKFSGKSKSTHDLLNDPKLSNQPAVSDEQAVVDPDEIEKHEQELETIRKKLQTESKKKTETVVKITNKDEEEEEEEEYYLGKDRVDERKRKAEDIRKEIKQLKQSWREDKKNKEEEVVESKKQKVVQSEMLKQYGDELEKYTSKQKTLPKKGVTREQYTLSLLNKFKEKLSSVKEKAEEGAEEKSDEDDEGDNWLAHKLQFEEQAPILARDANTKKDDWYEINDPRNPLNKRRREESKKMLQSKTGTRSKR